MLDAAEIWKQIRRRDILPYAAAFILGLCSGHNLFIWLSDIITVVINTATTLDSNWIEWIARLGFGAFFVLLAHIISRLTN